MNAAITESDRKDARVLTIGELINQEVAQYAALAVFRALDSDQIPIDRFPVFFREQAMATRTFQDFIWASTDMPHDHPLASFAKSHRRVDSGHYKWAEHDLKAMGMPAMTIDDFFSLEALPTRIQLARILAIFYDATPEVRMVVLACLEAAGGVTLGALHGYAERHGLVKSLHYLGDAHMRVEARQLIAIENVIEEVLASKDEGLARIVRTTFDALTRMFEEGSARLWQLQPGEVR